MATARKRPAAADDAPPKKSARDVPAAPPAVRSEAEGATRPSVAVAENAKAFEELVTPILGGLADCDAPATLSKIAFELLDHWELLIAGRRHRLLELEAYVHSRWHADPYTHGDEGQSSHGVWYFHRMGGSYKAGSFKGLDIACGSLESGTHAGLLMRSILDVDEDRVIEGPSLTVDRILKLNERHSIAELVAGRAAAQLPCTSLPELRLVKGTASGGTMWTAPRVGLVLRAESDAKTHSAGSPADFVARAYRFALQPWRLSKFRSGFAAVARLAGRDASKLGIPRRHLEAYDKATDEGVATADPSRLVDKKISQQPELCWLTGACEGLRRKSV